MKREGTIAATFLAIAAVVGFSLETGPKPEESGRVDRSGEIKRSKPALISNATQDMPGCSSLQSELQDFPRIEPAIEDLNDARDSGRNHNSRRKS
jgi:hypothetical protein